MSDKSAVTVRLEAQLQNGIQRIATVIDRPQSWVITRALEAFVAEQSWQIEEIEKALSEAQSGDFASEDEVAAMFAKWSMRPSCLHSCFATLAAL